MIGHCLLHLAIYQVHQHRKYSGYAAYIQWFVFLKVHSMIATLRHRHTAGDLAAIGMHVVSAAYKLPGKSSYLKRK